MLLHALPDPDERDKCLIRKISLKKQEFFLQITNILQIHNEFKAYLSDFSTFYILQPLVIA
jgi:hypothetical protein